MNKRIDIHGAVVLITGAGQGIGFALLEEALRRGAIPIAVEFNPEDSKKLENLIAGRGEVHIADVRSLTAMTQIAKATISRFGGIDIVIANAGIERVGLIQDMSADAFDAVIETNLLGVYRTLKPTIDSVIERKGYLLAISSIAALIPFPLAAAYSTSKARVDMLMRTLRMELSGTGATVGCAYFGFVQTAMADRIFSHPVISKAVNRLPSLLLGIKPLPKVDYIAKKIFNGIEPGKREL